MNKDIKPLIITNQNWNKDDLTPSITIITPVFNRRNTIKRAIDSVERQTFRNIEYIIIDDGSSDPIDDIIEEYMRISSLPVMFIKKQNGGVHTARNMGYKYARGVLVLNVDSDDEILPNGCEIFWEEWEKIPKDQIKHYWQMKAQCCNQDGIMTGTLFPDNINELPIKEAWVHFSLSHGDQSGCRVTSIMKENLFPEPEGVTFVSENILWIPLERKYKSWGINRVTDVVHTDGDDHLSRVHKKTLQTCRNSMWNAMFEINHKNTYILDFKTHFRILFRYCIMEKILFSEDPRFVENNRLLGWKNNLLRTVLWIPSMLGAYLYRKTRMT